MNAPNASRKQTRTAAILAGIVVMMLGAAYAAVPLYDLFCRVTGFGGTVLVASEESQEVLDREIVIRFDASLAAGMPWKFKPEVRQMTVKLGQNALAFYEAYNPTDQAIAGTASYNVAPNAAGGYFVKVHCFCFEQQVLQPGERVMMPVSFYVDPEILDDDEGRLLKEITLSYTFHTTEMPEGQASAGTAAGTTSTGGQTPVLAN